MTSRHQPQPDKLGQVLMRWTRNVRNWYALRLVVDKIRRIVPLAVLMELQSEIVCGNYR